MKDKNRIYLLLLIFTIFLTGCNGNDDKTSSSYEASTLIKKDLNGLVEEDLNRYEIDIKLDDKEKTYTGKQKTTFKNDTGQPLEEIYFRLYPNAFKSFEDAPILFSESLYTKETFKEGFIDIKKVSLKGEGLEYTIEGVDETLLNIRLEEALTEGEEIAVDMEYFVKLPTSQDRFGYGKNTMNFGNWYPVLSVYDEDGWSKDPYYSVGDPFYTVISNYDIDITVDKDIVVASSGNILEEKIVGEEKIYNIEGKFIRDFAFVASSDFKIREDTVDGTLVKLYYLKNNKSMAKKCLKYSIESIKTFNAVFGKYPYGVYSVVLTEFPSGMEYPSIVFINERYLNRRSKEILEQTIVHETAHQWWFGLVGNNQVKEAWLDEGLTSYSEVIYMDKTYGEKVGDSYFEYSFEIYYDMIEEYLRGEDDRVNKSLEEFTDWDDYGILAYTKAAIFLRDIEDRYGKETLLNIMSTYFKEYKYKNATTEGFLKICENITGESFKSLAEYWLQ